MTASIKIPHLELQDLAPAPEEEWARLLRFVGLTPQDKKLMANSTETLLQRSHELVVGTYDYLRDTPDTAAVLGWEKGVDEKHLQERRQFFSVWLSRTLGLDTSDEFAYYLFRAGKFHAGHGPRRIHTPNKFVTGSIGLVLAAFARYMQEAKLSGDLIAGAMAGWNKYLPAQLHMMQLGYEVARELDNGRFPIPVSLYGRLRPIAGCDELSIRVVECAQVGDLLAKFFSYLPQTRTEALERIWHTHDKESSLWLETYPVYRPKGGWRVLLNGRDLRYNGGFTAPIHAQDTIAIFPPGR
ncbi:MAG: MoaD/ThiS family protein [Anaerolineales bacterium]|nr:MoaD/ThiS family protein [Anaerolineales bacterium]